MRSHSDADLSDSDETKRAAVKEALRTLLRERSSHPAEGVRHVPLTYAQRQLWFLQELDPTSTAYVVSRGFKITGDLNISALETSIARLLARHEALRTCFQLTESGPVQQITENVAIQPKLIDATKMDADEQRRFWSQLCVSEQQAFDLATPPLLRVAIAMFGRNHYAVILSVHHSVVDGWSFDILLRELAILYAAQIAGTAPALAEAVQYSTYARWEQKGIAPSLAQYWQSRMAAAPPSLSLPTDFPPPAYHTFHGASHRFTIPATVRQSLEPVRLGAKATPFMLFLAAFKVLLYRYTNQADLVVGVPMANRLLNHFETTVGMFANSLPIRTSLAGSPPFTEILKRIRETVLGAFDHQGMPFEALVELLQPARQANRNPLFQVMFAYQNLPIPQLRLAGMQVEPLELLRSDAKFDLTLELTESDDGLVGRIEYRSDLFAESTIQRISDHYCTLLDCLAHCPSSSIDRLDYLTSAERAVLLAGVPSPSPERESLLPIHALISQQASRTPDRVAMVHGNREVTYTEMIGGANAVAAWLRRCSIGRHATIGIYAKPSPALVMAMLGILAVGAAYVPFDPATPPERLSRMLETAKPSILLAEQPDLLASSGVQASVADLHTIVRTQASPSSQLSMNLVTPGDLAYVIYTSGSTGHPKGAGVYHQGLSNLIRWYGDELSISKEDAFLVFTSPSFDLTQKNLFAPLCHGATIHIPADGTYDPVALTRSIADQRITVVNCTPSAFYPLVESLTAETRDHLQSLRYLCLGGEPIAMQRLWPWLGNPACGTMLLNTYGPTECTDVVAFQRANDPSTFLSRSIPIGQPITQTQMFVLDAHMNLVPLRVPGEIYIGGIGLGIGYRGRPDLTAAAFVPNPFSPQPGERLYRTGDIGRYNEDQTIEFIGRRDNQVKLRGFRIELSEIEAALLRHPLIRQAAALVWPGTAESDKLVAYIVAVPEHLIPDGEVRAHLRALLPDYMIPAQFVWLEALPLTPSGKLDRQRLPIVPAEPAYGTLAHTPLQEVISALWSEVLNQEVRDIHVDFFRLGGHSLLAAQVIARIRASLNVHVPLQAFLQAPTIVDLAGEVERRHHDQSANNGPSWQWSTDDPPVVSYQQDRRLRDEQRRPQRPRFHIGEAWRLRGTFDPVALRDSFTVILQRHEVLRTTFKLIDQDFVPIVRLADTVKIDTIDLRAVAEKDVDHQVQEISTQTAWRPFDLDHDPLLRVTLLRIAQEDHVLLIWMDHIAADGWSRTILRRELTALYAAAIAHSRQALPQLPMQYTDYAAMQHALLSTHGERLRNYWRTHLAGDLELRLPLDYDRTATPSFKGASLQYMLNPSLLPGLRALCRDTGATLFMVLLAGFQCLLSRLTGQLDIPVMTAVSLRSHIETEALIGNFTNLLVLRTNLDGNPSLRKVIERVRRVTIDAYMHQDLPIEHVKQEVDLDRVRSRVFFNLNSFPVEEFVLPGLTSAAVKIDPQLSTSELGISITEDHEGLRLFVSYKTALFKPETIDRLMRGFDTMLTCFVKSPSDPLNTINL